MKRRNVTNQSPGGKSNNSAKNSNNSANLASRLSKQLSNSDTASEVEKPGKTKKKKKRKSNKKKESVGSPSSDETSMYLFLTLCMLGNFACFFFCSLLIFSSLIFSSSSFRNTISMSNSLDPDQAQCYIGPDLGPNCLQKIISRKH